MDNSRTRKAYKPSALHRREMRFFPIEPGYQTIKTRLNSRAERQG